MWIDGWISSTKSAALKLDAINPREPQPPGVVLVRLKPRERLIDVRKDIVYVLDADG